MPRVVKAFQHYTDVERMIVKNDERKSVVLVLSAVNLWCIGKHRAEDGRYTAEVPHKGLEERVLRSQHDVPVREPDFVAGLCEDGSHWGELGELEAEGQRACGGGGTWSLLTRICPLFKYDVNTKARHIWEIISGL
jgi:hypothetical protein